MKKISKKNKEKIDWAKSFGVNPEKIIQLYGLRFTLKLLKHLTKSGKEYSDTTSPALPEFKVLKENEGKSFEQYYELLKECGFRLKEWSQDFVDEDTAEIVAVPRWEMYFINK